MSIKFYIVGGYVRDRILGREAKDHDYVVTGATVEDMIEMGFVPIEAQAFPVFHHPKTRDEYALARTEKKVGTGYHGFEVCSDPSVTIEQDLLRRDLTCNAMAREVVDWTEEGYAKLSDEIIDPYNGQADLRAGILRHVSNAFAEDPVRVLRVARFAARYRFEIAPETKRLMAELVDAGELDHLTAERVWTEFSKAISEDYPMQFIWALEECGARAVVFPELERASFVRTGHAVGRMALRNESAIHRMMWLFAGVEPDVIETMLERLKATADEQRLIIKFNKMRRLFDDGIIARPDRALEILKMVDVFRRPEDLADLSSTFAYETDTRIVDRYEQILRAYRACKHVSFASLTPEEQQTLKGKDVGDAIDRVRVDRIYRD